MPSETADVTALFESYAAALADSFTSGSTAAVAAFYEFPALVLRDEVSWAYDDVEALERDLEVPRAQAQGAGVVAVDVDVRTVEPLTQVLTSADVDLDFTNAEGATVLQQSWRYTVRRTEGGPRIRCVAIRDRVAP